MLSKGATYVWMQDVVYTILVFHSIPLNYNCLFHYHSSSLLATRNNYYNQDKSKLNFVKLLNDKVLYTSSMCIFQML